MFRGILKQKFGPSKKEDGPSNGEISSSMFRYCQSEESIKVMSLLLRTALVTSYSTSTVENSFTARNRVTSKGTAHYSTLRVQFENFLKNEEVEGQTPPFKRINHNLQLTSFIFYNLQLEFVFY